MKWFAYVTQKCRKIICLKLSVHKNINNTISFKSVAPSCLLLFFQTKHRASSTTRKCFIQALRSIPDCQPACVNALQTYMVSSPWTFQVERQNRESKAASELHFRIVLLLSFSGQTKRTQTKPGITPSWNEVSG